MAYFSRSDWGARPPNGGPGNLTRTRVEGIALHWPGTTRPTPIRGFAAVSLALRGWQRFHMDDRGWSDIAYQEAIDQDGNVYQLRGLAIQSGANGDASTNQRFGALLLVLIPGERPTAAMVAAVRKRVAKHRELFGNSKRLVGHGQIRAGGTACPGAAAQSFINKGVFEPTQEDDDMAYNDWPKAHREALVGDVVKALLRADISKPGEPRLAVEQALRQASNAPGVVRNEHGKDRRA